jgi:GT2 family glycosyltransferase
VETEFPRAMLIRNSENRGFAAANNQGIAASRGRYILLLNSDTLVMEDVLARTVGFADAHPRAAVVGCRVLNPDGTLQPTCFMFPSVLNMLLSATYLYKLMPRSRFFGRERMTWWDRNDERQVEVVTGCFMLVRREAIEQVGTMDERFFMYAEETDWCYRFMQAGWQVWFTPGGRIVHLGGQSSKSVKGAMLVQLRLSILKFMKKHYGRMTYATATFLTTAFFIMRMPWWYGKALVDSDGRQQALDRARAYSRGVASILFSQG